MTENQKLLSEVLTKRQELLVNGHYGPFRLILPEKMRRRLTELYDPEFSRSTLTLGERLREIQSIGELVIQKSVDGFILEPM